MDTGVLGLPIDEKAKTGWLRDSSKFSRLIDAMSLRIDGLELGT